ncbi:hypothetical protein MST27_05025 [Pseudomonas sp. PS1]|uniref:Uncharacterized protein n=1 Tax=Stutzerimonas marianensis TaxID=2929513 RepID=A0A9X1W3T9_9GAMM|nr:hypothetical protein [Pseudomonas marianensis]MCJ0972729.1 hypothetical protein [Pseudomonas marianensis]
MTKHDLKELSAIGAELAAAKAEVQLEMERHRKTWRQLEQVRGLLRECRPVVVQLSNQNGAELFNDLVQRIDAALSLQAEPVCRCTMREKMVGDGCSVCNPERAADFEDDEPAPAQAEQRPVGWQSIVLHASELADMVLKGDAPQTAQRTARALLSMLATRPAQTEQQPEQSGLKVTVNRKSLERVLRHDFAEDCQECAIGRSEAWAELRAALSAQG